MIIKKCYKDSKGQLRVFINESQYLVFNKTKHGLCKGTVGSHNGKELIFSNLSKDLQIRVLNIVFPITTYFINWNKCYSKKGIRINKGIQEVSLALLNKLALDKCFIKLKLLDKNKPEITYFKGKYNN
jgi:hypothetical protein